MIIRITYFLGIGFMALAFFSGEGELLQGGAILAAAAVIGEAICMRRETKHASSD